MTGIPGLTHGAALPLEEEDPGRGGAAAEGKAVVAAASVPVVTQALCLASANLTEEAGGLDAGPSPGTKVQMQKAAAVEGMLENPAILAVAHVRSKCHFHGKQPNGSQH